VTPSTTAGAGTQALFVDLPATATSGGITVTTTVSAMLGHVLAFTGATAAAAVGDTILVQRLDPVAGWVSVASGPVAPGGAFSILWRANDVGHLVIRVILEQAATTSSAGAAAPTLEVTVYRPARATIYGRGFFGQLTACGQTLTRKLLGVASRTLKCGTSVQIYYGGKMIVVPVIDRGPYANHATWDLTQATAQQLGMTGTETVGAVAL
jgi:hypothetical protein